MDDSPETRADLDTTIYLLTRVRQGDPQALDRLFARYLPPLRRWASGRLPRWARDLAETQDLVQDTLLQVFKKIEGFDYRGEGAFQAYLRQALMNRLRNEIRRADRRPDHDAVDQTGAAELVSDDTSPLEAAIGREALQQYDDALQRLSDADREAIIARVELGMTYDQMAQALNKPTAGAARLAVTRALVRLAAEMKS